MATTRAQIRARLSLLLGEMFGSTGSADPFTLDLLVEDRVKALCRATDCYFTGATADLTGTVAVPSGRLCAPDLYRIPADGITITRKATSGGGRVTLPQVSPRDMVRYDSQWRTAPKAGEPTQAIVLLPDIELYPVPDYAAQEGVQIVGWGVPQAWAYSMTTGAALPAADTDPYPLPERTLEALLYDVCAVRCTQMAGHSDPQVRAAARSVYPLWQERANEERGRLESEAARQWDVARAGGLGGGAYQTVSGGTSLTYPSLSASSVLVDTVPLLLDGGIVTGG